MTKTIFYALTLAILLVSCNKTTSVYFRTNDAKGLEIGDFVMIDQQNIGKVTGFGLTDDGDVIISSDIESELPIPNNSKFKNVRYSEDGKRCIEVTLGNSDTPIADNDTLKLKVSHGKLIDEGKKKLLDKIKDKFGKD